MATKRFIIDYPQTGLTVYCIIRREIDNYIFDDSIGDFSNSPVDPYQTMVENSFIKKRYEFSEDRNEWSDGNYSVVAYSQIGPSPDLINDVLIGSCMLKIYNDAEVFALSAEEVDSRLSLTHGSGSWTSSETSTILDTLVRFNMFEYKGDQDNEFSIIVGSFIGTVNFYTVSMSNFLVSSNNPPLTNLICSLNSNGIMTNTSLIGVSGDIIFFTLENFEALSDIVINYFNYHLNTNNYFFIPKGLKTVTNSTPYYPTVSGGLYGPVSTNYATPIYGGLSNMNIFNLAYAQTTGSTIVVEQPSILTAEVTRLTMIKDRTIDLTFNLHRDLVGDTIYFAMKTDKRNNYYDVGPLECTITDATRGYVSLTIDETITQNLETSKYYGEIMRLTAEGQYQTIILYEIDLIDGVIATGDL